MRAGLGQFLTLVGALIVLYSAIVITHAVPADGARLDSAVATAIGANEAIQQLFGQDTCDDACCCCGTVSCAACGSTALSPEPVSLFVSGQITPAAFPLSGPITDSRPSPADPPPRALV